MTHVQMSDLDRGQRKRAQTLARAGLSRRDAAALVSIWDGLPEHRRWALMTEDERDALRTADPERASRLDRLAEEYLP